MFTHKSIGLWALLINNNLLLKNRYDNNVKLFAYIRYDTRSDVPLY